MPVDIEFEIWDHYNIIDLSKGLGLTDCSL